MSDRTPYSDFVSDEPLSVIEANECRHDVPSLVTKRFRAVFNELARLRRAEADMRERAAVGCERAARALISGRARTNAIDRHTADILMRRATTIRALPLSGKP